MALTLHYTERTKSTLVSAACVYSPTQAKNLQPSFNAGTSPVKNAIKATKKCVLSVMTTRKDK